jgi:hypothetical protein
MFGVVGTPAWNPSSIQVFDSDDFLEKKSRDELQAELEKNRPCQMPYSIHFALIKNQNQLVIS